MLASCHNASMVEGEGNDVYTTSRGSNSSSNSSSVAAAVEQLFFRVEDMRACHGQRLVIMLSFFV